MRDRFALSRTLCWLVAGLVLAGCTPRVRVLRHPGPRDQGIRYYRPKPYLLVTPAEATSGAGRTATVTPVDNQVKIAIQYLPDFSEEYALDVRPGLGRADVSVQLEDGWNLVSIDQDIDSQFDENLSAISDVMKGVASVASATPPNAAAQTWFVRATNVPLGLYEAVLGTGQRGGKHLYGFRYVGFLPYSPCPVCPTGHESASCCDGTLALYGLVFEEGVMMFRPIGEIAGVPGQSERVPITTGTLTTARTTETTTTSQDGEVIKTVTEERIERLPTP